MSFKTYWQGLTVAQREAFADDVGSTVGYCHQIAYGGKSIELGLADAMVAVAAGGLDLNDLPLTERAKRQRIVRAQRRRRIPPQTAKAL